MDSIEIIPLLSRWVHILSAITALGGTVFLRCVLMPTAEAVLSNEDHQRLREAIRKKWMIVIHSCILLFLLSGFYNYLVVTAPNHVGQSGYHALFGIKFLCALLLFFLAIAVSGRSARFTRFREQRKRWLSVIILLGVVIVLVSGLLKQYPIAPVTLAVERQSAASSQ